MKVDQVCQDFPVLRNNPDLHYLDSACTTLKPDPVVDAVSEYYNEYPVCGDRSVHRLGVSVTRSVERARTALAAAVGAETGGVVFTRNATEAINQVAAGMRWRPGDIVITSDKEHNSNFVPWVRLQAEGLLKHVVVPTNDDGTWNGEAFDQAVADAGADLRLVSTVHVSNADGVRFPVEKIARAAHDAGALMLVDAAQSAGHGGLDVRDLGADFVALSLHKMLGPSGVGALVSRPDALGALRPLQLGGGTVSASRPGGFDLLDVPHRFEAGLANFASLVAVPAGLEYLAHVGGADLEDWFRRLNARLTKRLQQVEGVRVLGPAPRDRSAIVPFVVDGLDAHDVAVHLDDSADVAVRSGAHCVHSYFAARGVAGSVRASFHAYTRTADVDALADAVGRLRAGLS